MKTTLVVLGVVLLAVALDARSVFKRSNTYGDEPSAPSGGGGGGEQPAPEAAPQPEAQPAAVEQPAPAATGSQSSGYRKKRNNRRPEAQPAAVENQPSAAAPQQSAPSGY
ncbi:Epicuticlin [Aphelenchoides fujianensis]|nr:Epicuticlin [Aphelenchoides fujianensis]